MLQEERRFKIFLEVVKALNKEFGIKPILYGSFGLEQVLRKNLKAQDIDVLISDGVLENSWDKLVRVMSGLGFVLDDLKEHEFVRVGERLAFAPQSDLAKLTGLTSGMLKNFKVGGAEYKGLNASQYLTLYESLRDDPYRRKTGKMQKDEEKIKMIKELLESTEKL